MNLAAEIVALILQIGPLGVQLFDKIHSSTQLGADEQTNIMNAVKTSNEADQATVDAADAWLAAHP